MSKNIVAIVTTLTRVKFAGRGCKDVAFQKTPLLGRAQNLLAGCILLAEPTKCFALLSESNKNLPAEKEGVIL